MHRVEIGQVFIDILQRKKKERKVLKVSRGDESFNLPVIDEKLPDPKSIPLRKRKANDENVEKKLLFLPPFIMEKELFHGTVSHMYWLLHLLSSPE